jgi:hypothetical protein
MAGNIRHRSSKVIGYLNSSLAEGCLSHYSLAVSFDVQTALATWRENCKVSPPHISLGRPAPIEYFARVLAGAELEEAI